MCSSAPQPLAAATADNIPDLLALRSRAARESTPVVPDHPLPLHRPEIPPQHIRWGSEHVMAALLLVPVFVMASLLLAMPPRQVSRTSQLNSTPSITAAVARAAVIPRFGRLPQSRATANLALQSLPESKRNVRMSLVASASSSPSEQVEPGETSACRRVCRAACATVVARRVRVVGGGAVFEQDPDGVAARRVAPRLAARGALPEVAVVAGILGDRLGGWRLDASGDRVLYRSAEEIHAAGEQPESAEQKRPRERRGVESHPPSIRKVRASCTKRHDLRSRERQD